MNDADPDTPTSSGRDRAPIKAIAVPVWMLGLLVIGLLGSLISTAYLLGQRSGLQDQQATGHAVVLQPEKAGEAGDSAADTGKAEQQRRNELREGMMAEISKEATSPASASPDIPPAATVIPTSPSPATATEDTPASDEAAASVRDYFDAMERTYRGGKTWTDPDSFAQAVLQQAMSGDVSGLRTLRDTQLRVLQGVERVPAPLACSAHHTETTAILRQSVAVMGDMANALEKGDAKALVKASSRAQDLEARSREADRTAKSIRARYGLNGG